MAEKEFVVPVGDIGVDGAYFGYTELIRCKDCKHHGEQYGNGYCMKDGCYGWSDEDYCSRAERKPPQVNPEMVKALKDRIEKQRGEDAKRKS